MLKRISNPILSGICIGLSAWISAVIGDDALAGLGFAFGFIIITLSGLWLFTASAGELAVTEIIRGRRFPDFETLKFLFGYVLLGNIIGAGIIGVAVPGMISPDQLLGRIDLPWYEIVFKGIMSGLIIDLVFCGWRDRGSWLGMIIGLPVAYLLGFLHSITEVTYLVSAGVWSGFLVYLPLLILSNIIGCRLRKWFT
jgi:formate/nitrite transporter FocA (FNT family)